MPKPRKGGGREGWSEKSGGTGGWRLKHVAFFPLPAPFSLFFSHGSRRGHTLPRANHRPQGDPGDPGEPGPAARLLLLYGFIIHLSMKVGDVRRCM